ncbi:hypothetical protein [Psychrobacter pygoscelis]|uniref:hypothetical protein n=1 Tax=Psychrobacter pygoscelis TaxID=2488563 RepID=UPI00103D1C79|nr:hypothetical protein [Psychrobacter pygoscelis]
MTVQIPDPGLGDGRTGDNEYVFRSKVKSNFSDQSNAASRLVGTENKNVIEITGLGMGSSGLGVIHDQIPNTVHYPDFDINQSNKLHNGLYAVDSTYRVDNPTKVAGLTTNFALLNINSRIDDKRGCQIALPRFTNKVFLMMRTMNADEAGGWTEFYNSKSTSIYQTTTASSPNVFVTSTGELQRSTSSERYKNIIAELELDDDAYQKALAVKPIVYRSTAPADNPNWHYYSFSAEKLGEYDPAFTLWRNTETVTDDEGNTETVELDTPLAEGINLNAIVALQHAVIVKQGKLIASLEKRIMDVENAIE